MAGRSEANMEEVILSVSELHNTESSSYNDSWRGVVKICSRLQSGQLSSAAPVLYVSGVVLMSLSHWLSVSFKQDLKVLFRTSKVLQDSLKAQYVLLSPVHALGLQVGPAINEWRKRQVGPLRLEVGPAAVFCVVKLVFLWMGFGLKRAQVDLTASVACRLCRETRGHTFLYHQDLCLINGLMTCSLEVSSVQNYKIWIPGFVTHSPGFTVAPVAIWLSWFLMWCMKPGCQQHTTTWRLKLDFHPLLSNFTVKVYVPALLEETRRVSVVWWQEGRGGWIIRGSVIRPAHMEGWNELHRSLGVESDHGGRRDTEV